jgi:hypothetical protein
MQNKNIDNEILLSLQNANNNIFYSESLSDLFQDNEKNKLDLNSFIKFKNHEIKIDHLINLKFKKNKFNIVLCISNKINSGSILDMPELIEIYIYNKHYSFSDIKLKKIQIKSVNDKDIYIISYTCKSIKEL